MNRPWEIRLRYRIVIAAGYNMRRRVGNETENERERGSESTGDRAGERGDTVVLWHYILRVYKNTYLIYIYA